MKIDVLLTEEVFRRFTMFDVLKRRKAWKPPVIFAGILGLSAAICYWMDHVDGAVLLGNVLLTIGLGMPVVYFTTFFISLRKEVLRHGLSRPQQVYTLELTQNATKRSRPPTTGGRSTTLTGIPSPPIST